MTNLVYSMRQHQVYLATEIEDATQFIEQTINEYAQSDSDTIKTDFDEQAELFFRDIEYLNSQRRITGLGLNSSFEKLKGAFREFLKASKPHVGNAVERYEIALLKIESPFMTFLPIKKEMQAWIEMLDSSFIDAQAAQDKSKKRKILYSVKNRISTFIHGSYSAIRQSLRDQECEKIFLKLEASFDRASHLLNDISGSSRCVSFRGLFPDFFKDNNLPYSVSSLSNPNVVPSPAPSVSFNLTPSPFIQLVEAAVDSLRTPDTTPSSSSSSSSSSIQLDEQPQVRTSGRKRTASSKLTSFSDESEITSPAAKKAKVVKQVKRMPSLSPESYGEPVSLDQVIGSLKPQGQRTNTNMVYISSNKYDTFYEQFWHGQKGWIAHFKKNLNTPENAKLKGIYDAYKAQSLEDRSKNFRIRQSDQHKVFGHMLFSTKTIRKGEIVGEYRGNVIPETLLANGNKYIFQFAVTKDTEVRKYMIDGGGLCNETAFLVHNSEEYCNTEIAEYFDEEGPHILIIAKKEIPAGHALSFNYGDGYWEAMGLKPLCLPH